MSEEHRIAPPPHAADEFDLLADRFVRACVEGRRLEAMNLALRVLEESPQELPLATFYDEVLRPAQRLVGDLWHNGEATTAQEHATTETTRSVAALARARYPRKVGRGERIVLACPAGELHDLGLRLIADVLDLDGYETHLLGANTPIDDLIAYARGVSAGAVLLSACTDASLDALLAATNAVAGLPDGPAVVVGGRTVQDRDVVPDGVFAAYRCDTAAGVVEQALAARR